MGHQTDEAARMDADLQSMPLAEDPVMIISASDGAAPKWSGGLGKKVS